jgi:hypothetical protein
MNIGTVTITVFIWATKKAPQGAFYVFGVSIFTTLRIITDLVCSL